MTRMFEFITQTWNPLRGRCPHNCRYCWSSSMAKRLNMSKYTSQPVSLDQKKLDLYFEDDEFIFVQSMSDLFAHSVPRCLILMILMKIRKANPKTQFLLMTKAPARYLEFNWSRSGPEIILGTTIETDLNYFRDVPNKYLSYARISDCPETPSERLNSMMQLKRNGVKNKMFISIEPILDFNPKLFLEAILKVEPEMIAIGRDNYGFELPSPSENKMLKLIDDLKSNGVIVFEKTLGLAWWE